MKQEQFYPIRLDLSRGIIALQALILLVFSGFYSTAQTVDGEHAIDFFDRWGTGYSVVQLNASPDSSLYSSVYSVGAFELHYNATEFSLSELNALYQEATSFQTEVVSTATLGTVRLCVMKDNNTSGISASSIYTPMMMWGGVTSVSDGQVIKTLISGNDGYGLVLPDWFTTPLFHGVIKVGNLSSLSSAQVTTMYHREFLALLGINSLIQPNGESVFGTGSHYYSRLDGLTQADGVNSTWNTKAWLKQEQGATALVDFITGDTYTYRSVAMDSVMSHVIVNNVSSQVAVMSLNGNQISQDSLAYYFNTGIDTGYSTITKQLLAMLGYPMEGAEAHYRSLPIYAYDGITSTEYIHYGEGNQRIELTPMIMGQDQLSNAAILSDSTCYAESASGIIGVQWNETTSDKSSNGLCLFQVVRAGVHSEPIAFYYPTTVSMLTKSGELCEFVPAGKHSMDNGSCGYGAVPSGYQHSTGTVDRYTSSCASPYCIPTVSGGALSIMQDIPHYNGSAGSFMRLTAKAHTNQSDFEEFAKVPLVATLAAGGEYRLKFKARSAALDNTNNAYVTFALSTSNSMVYNPSTFNYFSNGSSVFVKTVPVALPPSGTSWVDVEYDFTLPIGYTFLNTLHVGLAFNTSGVSMNDVPDLAYAVLLDELYLQQINYTLDIPYDTLCLGQVVSNLNQYVNPPINPITAGLISGTGVVLNNNIYNLTASMPLGEQIITFQSTDNPSCTTTDNIVIVDHLTLPINVVDPVCEGNPTIASVDLPPGITSSPIWSIQPDNSFYTTNPISFVVDEASTIYFTNNTACNITGIANVGVIGTPPASGTVFNVVNGSNNGSIDLSVLNAYQSVHWSGPNGFTSVSEDIFNLSVGTYTAIIVFPTGCEQVVQFQVHSISLTYTLSTCYDPCIASNCNLNSEISIETMGELDMVLIDGTTLMTLGAMVGYMDSLCPGNHNLVFFLNNCSPYSVIEDIQVNCNDFANADDLVLLSGTTIWGIGSDTIHGNVIINNGATLNIAASTHRFLPRKRIIVQPGGTLRILKGAVLTAYCEQRRWMGVEVRGNTTNPALASTLIGSVLSSGGTIKNASLGVLIGQRGNGDNVADFGYSNLNVGSGGKANLRSTTFLNNLQDFAAARLNSYISQISINNCSFKLDSAYFSFGDSIIPMDRIEIKFRSKISITNSQIFNRNSSLFNMNGFQAVAGFRAVFSDFYMKNCYFSGLPYGIYQNGSSVANNGTHVYDSRFSCYRGAYFSMGNKHQVTNCSFYSLESSLGNLGENFPALPSIFIDDIPGDEYDNDLTTNGVTFNSAYGLYYKNMTQFECTGNYLDFTINNYNAANMLRVGIYVQNSSHNYLSYLTSNEINSCTVGIRFYDSNRSASGEVGMLFKCNELKMNDYDVEINAAPGVNNPINFGIKKNQGGPSEGIINYPHNSFFTTNDNPWDDMNDFVSPAPGYHTYYYNENDDVLDTSEVHNIILMEVNEYNANNNVYLVPKSMCDGTKTLPEDFMGVLDNLTRDIQRKQSQIADSIYQMGFQDYVMNYLALSDNANDDEIFSYLLVHATNLNDKTLFELAQQTNHFTANQVLQILQASSVSGYNDEVVLNFAYNHPSITSSQYTSLVNSFDAVAERMVLSDSLGLLSDSLQTLLGLALEEIALDSTSQDTTMLAKCMKIQLLDELCAITQTELQRISNAMYKGEFDLADTLISLYREKLHPDMQTSKDLDYLHTSLMDLYRMYYLTDSTLSTQDSLTLEYFSMPEYPMTFRFATHLLDVKVNNLLRETLNYPQVNHYRIQFADQRTEEPVDQSSLYLLLPNPSSGQVVIRAQNPDLWKDLIGLAVYDITGKCVYRLTNPASLGTCFNQGFHLQAADGLYTVQLITVQGTFNQKLILQH